MDMYKMQQLAMRRLDQRAFDQRAFAARSRAAGFTLIEMLVLLGIVMAIVGGKVMQNFQNGEYKAGIAAVHSLEMKVQAYMLDNGSSPQSLNDLITRPGNASN